MNRFLIIAGLVFLGGCARGQVLMSRVTDVNWSGQYGLESRLVDVSGSLHLDSLTTEQQLLSFNDTISGTFFGIFYSSQSIVEPRSGLWYEGVPDRFFGVAGFSFFSAIFAFGRCG